MVNSPYSTTAVASLKWSIVFCPGSPGGGGGYTIMYINQFPGWIELSFKSWLQAAVYNTQYKTSDNKYYFSTKKTNTKISPTSRILS